MKGWKWAEENPDDAAMIVLENDETGAQTEAHQKRMMGEIAKLTAGSDGTLDPADYERTVKTLLSAGSDPVITKEPEGAWTPRRDRQGARELSHRRAAPRGPASSRRTGDALERGGARAPAGAVCRRSRAGGCTTRSSRGWPSGCSAAARGRRRSSGVPTFLTAPHRPVEPGRAGLRRARRGDQRRAGRPRRRQPPGHALRAAGGADDRAGRALQPRARLRADLRSARSRTSATCRSPAATTSPRATARSRAGSRRWWRRARGR